MSCRLQPFEMQAIDTTMKNDFTNARFRLISVYLLIIAAVVLLFSFLIIYQARDSFGDPAIETEKAIVLSRDEALLRAAALHPGGEVEETEYEIEDGALLFTVTYTDEVEVKVDLISGEAAIPEESKGLFAAVTDDFEEQVGWIALVVFLVAALGSTYVAHRTLTPIAQNIQKQKQFISGAAHELRNPLAALHARIESFLRAGTKEVTRDVLSDLLSEVKRLITTSEMLLQIERAESPQKIEQLDVESVVVGVKNRLAPLLEAKQLQLKLDIEKTPLSFGRGDLDTILYNVLHNAVKFSKPDGSITVTWHGGTLSVADSGIGIPTEEIPHVFDRFYKGQSAHGENADGNGLGLSLVDDIARKYGACITIESMLGKGTSVAIRF